MTLPNTPAALAFCEALMVEADRQAKEKAADVLRVAAPQATPI